jgi:hypothetical protein
MSGPDNEYGICSACGEEAFDWPRCKECGSVDQAYLHDKVKRDLRAMSEALTQEVRRNEDGSWSVAA